MTVASASFSPVYSRLYWSWKKNFKFWIVLAESMLAVNSISRCLLSSEWYSHRMICLFLQETLLGSVAQLPCSHWYSVKQFFLWSAYHISISYL